MPQGGWGEGKESLEFFSWPYDHYMLARGLLCEVDWVEVALAGGKIVGHEFLSKIQTTEIFRFDRTKPGSTDDTFAA